MASRHVTYSSADLRARDQIIIEKYEKEKDTLERKIQRMKYAADENKKQLFDALHRARRIAQSLGFEDVYDAQVAIDSADYDISFRECLARIQTLEVQLCCEKKEVEILQANLRNVEDENRRLQTRLRHSEDENRKVKADLEMVKVEKIDLEASHNAEAKQLNERYDALKCVKERAAERYKADFKKWRDFSKWLFAEHDEHHKHRNESGITAEEKKRRDIANVMRKRQKMIEIGPDLARFEGEPEDDENSSTPRHPPSLGPIYMECDKENEGTPVPSQKKRRALSDKDSSIVLSGTTPPIALRDTLLKSVTNIAAPSSSPTVFLTTSTTTPTTTRTPLSFHPIPDTIHIKQEPSSTPSPVTSNPLNRSFPHLPSSSDTEDDSQAVHVPSTNPRSGQTAIFKVPVAPPSLNRHNAIEISTSLPSRPLFVQAQEPRRKPNLCVAEPMRAKELHQQDIRPSKVRRIIGDEFSRPEASSSRHQLTVPSSNTRQLQITPFPSAKGKETEREVLTAVATPLTSRNMGQKRMDDYSAFKGRGRYGNADNRPHGTTINALYTIDPTENGGINYQFDEVVRCRDDRRKMDAGDCECCREYYRSVGPLPNRLQQPLWRSPPATPAKPCPRHTHSPDSGYGSRGGSSSTRGQTEIDSHKKAISRHRHTWARANTPPGYWDIGFPNTQEVDDINEKAKEMHKRKKDEIDKEATIEGGRYRRK